MGAAPGETGRGSGYDAVNVAGTLGPGIARAFYAGTDGAGGAVEVVALGVLGRPCFDDSTTVTVALGRIALRGAPASGPVDIRYTTDGTEPTPASASYSAPLCLHATTTVRAAAFRDGLSVASSFSVFTQGRHPATAVPAAPRADQGAAEDPTQQRKK